MSKEMNIPKIPAEKFKFVSNEDRLHDQKFSTKQIGYFRDAFNRFCKNKGSVVAAIIILCLVLFSIIAPILGANNYTERENDNTKLQYTKLVPKNPLFAKWGLGFWDGGVDKEVSADVYNDYMALTAETGLEVVLDYKGSTVDAKGNLLYQIRKDAYVCDDKGGYLYMTLSEEEYKNIQAWQKESGIQVIYPAVDNREFSNQWKSNAAIWYQIDERGRAVLAADGSFQPIYRTGVNDGGYDSLRIPGDPGLEDPTSPDRYRYARVTGDSNSISYNCRILKYNYFQYRYGFEPYFLFGTDANGYDIMTRLAQGAQFSFIFAILISAINLTIGAVYGAIEGYYGGWIDMAMERFSDILSRVPFMVVTTLFQLYLAKKVGPVVALLFAFVLTGWIGMASTVRMQFYRYKGQEYILAARSLGASDGRLMFRHIFPNSLGTIITSSVLVIPGVINSESSLTYLGIVNLDSEKMTSAGTMLANGKGTMMSNPHILLFPALFLALLMISFNLFGNGLRDAFNPSLRGADE